MVQLQSEQLKPPSSAQRIVHSGITWRQFKLIQSGFGNARNVRLFYYDNIVEIKKRYVWLQLSTNPTA